MQRKAKNPEPLNASGSKQLAETGTKDGRVTAKKEGDIDID
jgi:hypothetical protein